MQQRRQQEEQEREREQYSDYYYQYYQYYHSSVSPPPPPHGYALGFAHGGGAGAAGPAWVDPIAGAGGGAGPAPNHPPAAAWFLAPTNLPPYHPAAVGRDFPLHYSAAADGAFFPYHPAAAPRDFPPFPAAADGRDFSHYSPAAAGGAFTNYPPTATGSRYFPLYPPAAAAAAAAAAAGRDFPDYLPATAGRDFSDYPPAAEDGRDLPHYSPAAAGRDPPASYTNREFASAGPAPAGGRFAPIPASSENHSGSPPLVTAATTTTRAAHPHPQNSPSPRSIRRRSRRVRKMEAGAAADPRETEWTWTRNRSRSRSQEAAAPSSGATPAKPPRCPPSAKSGGVPEPTPAYLAQALVPSRRLDRPRHILVVLDLNGTLLYRPDHFRPTHIVARPHAEQFLRYCAAEFRVVVWSSARPGNVAGMCLKLMSAETRARVVAVMSRDDLGLSKADYSKKTQVYKRLATVWDRPDVIASHPSAGSGGRWDHTNTVLVDDSREKGRTEPHNLLEVREYDAAGSRAAEETVLPQVHDYLNQLCYQENISSFMREFPFVLDLYWTLERSAVGY